MKLLCDRRLWFIGSNFIRHVLTEHADDRVVNLDKLTYAGNRRTSPISSATPATPSCTATSATPSWCATSRGAWTR